MNAAYSKLKKTFKKLNQREYTFDDFERIAKRQRIKIATYSMSENVRGYYSTDLRKVYRKKCIVFNDCLSKYERLYVAFHELAHHFLHVTLSTKQTYFCRAFELTEIKQDLEADALALIMMIPQKLLFEMAATNFEDVNPFFANLLIRRQAIYENFGV